LFLAFLALGWIELLLPADSTVDWSHRNILLKSEGVSRWSRAEKEAVKSLLEILPEEYFSLGRIAVVRQAGRGERPGFWVSFHRRVIQIPAGLSDAGDLQRAILGGLSRMLDRRYGYSESEEWRSISRWNGWDHLYQFSENVNDRGFVHPLARKNPEDDFVFSVMDFFCPPEYSHPCDSMRYRLPSKYRFIQTRFDSRPDPQGSCRCGEDYRSWIHPDDVQQLELLIATPSYAHIASIAGHLSLLIRRKGDISGLSTVVSFVANNVDQEGGLEQGMAYILKGIFGGYRSVILEETLLDVVLRQTIAEDRDIYRLKLELDREQIDRVIMRLWEMKTHFNYRYYFFNKNCTTMLLNLINFVLPEDQKIRDRDMIDLPLHVVSKMYRSHRADFIYPEYWSISRGSRFSYRKNQKIAGGILAGLSRHFPSAKLDPVRRRFQALQKTDVGGRAGNYQGIYRFYRNLAEPGNMNGGQREELARIGRELLEFFINSKDLEKYRFFKSRSSAVETGDGNVPMSGNDPALLEREEMRVLMRIILNLRYVLKEEFAVEGSRIYRALDGEKSRLAMEERKKSGFGSGYGRLTLGPEYLNHPRRQWVSFTLDLATYSQTMGDKSIFSMGPGTAVELFALKMNFAPEAKRGTDTGSEDFGWFEHEFTLLKFRRVFKKNRIDYHGFFNPGFGFEVYSHSSGRLSGLPKRLTYFRLEHLLNLFERNDFNQFMNVAIGAGLTRVSPEQSEGLYFLDIMAELSGKFHLMKRYPNAVRYSIRYNQMVSLGESVHSHRELTFGIVIDLLVNSRQNRLLSLGVQYRRHVFPDTWNIQGNPHSLALYSVLKFNGRLTPSVKGFQKAFNRCF